MPNPKVLLTHIPLYRADGTNCGPYRSSPIINQVCFHCIFLSRCCLSSEVSDRLRWLVMLVYLSLNLQRISWGRSGRGIMYVSKMQAAT